MSDKKYTSINRDKAAGRVEFQGGKSVWHWSQDQNESTSILLKSLENPDLELEKTQRTPVARPSDPKHVKSAAKEQAKSGASVKKKGRKPDDENPWGLPQNRGGGGFDPYNRS